MTQLRWVKAIKNRISYFQSRFHAHEAGRLTLALKAIEELIPPSEFLEEVEQPSEQGDEGLQKAAFEYATKMSSAPDKETPDWIIADFIAGAKYILSKEVSADGWISVKDRQPDIGDCYNVVWDLKDGEEPVTTTMEFDAINKKWIDVIGEGFDSTTEVLFWQPLPKPPTI